MTALRSLVALPLLLILAACQRDERAAGVPAEERAAPAPPPEVVGYHPDSLAWLREGRPVMFGGKEWRPVGEPLHEESDRFQRVGDFEGMALYAPADELAPYAHLFIPFGNDVWQALEPADTAQAGAAGGAGS
ncbi:MAG: hypothetical protein HY561_02665 [Gemmatimonadetes bacterium]|nr:hypothetical protein [Gemmatimonadota bacterium]